MLQLNSLMVGVLSSVIATIITSLVWLAWNRSRRRDALWAFFGLSQVDETLVCYGNVQKEKLIDSNDSRSYTTFEYGDMASVLLVYDRLKNTYLSKVRHSVGYDLQNMPHNRNIVSIGGPKWNKLTEELIGRVGSPLYFNHGCTGIIEKRRTHQNENVYSPETHFAGGDSRNVKDYGFIICSRYSYLGHRIPCAVTIAGFSTYGVLIATEFLMRLEKSDIRTLAQRLKGEKRFGLLIEGVIKGDKRGRLIVGSTPKLILCIPEQDFADPYEYGYGESKVD